MAKNFKDYLLNQERDHTVRIKTVVPLEEEQLNMIERVLQKYVLKDITKPTKTIFQRQPLDFYDVKNAEIYIIDATCKMPVSPYILLQELKLALNIPENYIVVRGEGDPLEIESQRRISDEAIEKKAQDSDSPMYPSARLSTNNQYDEDELNELTEPLFGSEYNVKFIETLAKIAKERAIPPVPVQPMELNVDGTRDKNVAASQEVSSCIKAPDLKYPNYAETLKNLRKLEKPTSIGNSKLGVYGNYDDDEISRSKKYDKYNTAGDKVATVVIQNVRPGIRKY